MKILLIHDYGDARGGAELRMLALRRGLRQRGHEVQLFASNAGVGEKGMLADRSCFGTVGRGRRFVETFNLDAARQLRHLIDEFQPDVAHIKMFMTQLSPAILPVLRGVPTIYHPGTYKSGCPSGTRLLPNGSHCQEKAGWVCRQCIPLVSMPIALAQQALCRAWFDSIQKVVAISEAMKATLEGQGIGNVEVLLNGVAERSMRKPLEGVPVVAFVGRIVPEKGLDVLLRAFQTVKAKMPAAELWVFGEGFCPKAEGVRAFGHLGQVELESYLEKVWVQVVPSLWAEPFGNVIAEAAMRGSVVVASAVGGAIDQVVDGETGMLVPAGNVEALQDVLLELLADFVRLEEMGLAAHRHASAHFSEQRWLDRWEAIYAELISSRH
jgi:glycosyltransferase involved in cell wall biosynthesis